MTQQCDSKPVTAAYGYRMSSIARRVAGSVSRAVQDVNAAQRALWERQQRFETATLYPPDDRYLHWEPTASGWRLYGEALPPEP